MVPILDSSSIKWVQPNTLVRFRGMIHDMLGNEFYAGAYKDKTNGLNVLLWSSRTVFWISLAKNREKRAGWMKQGLIWLTFVVLDCFLVKQFGRGNTKVQFSKEANNLCNINSYNHSGNFYYNDLCYCPYNYDLLLSELRNMTRIHVHF
ncbi:hypothetical protein F2Q70_00006110 [Brassica cretica]|uniref:Uncharacterized protein n=1 Tax=Brassica cretica TaxID=69181 RepID=A0A8S9ILB4_BRACR|nr:hypothetical protein F2Q70_00006110 [Brassica cretica]